MAGTAGGSQDTQCHPPTHPGKWFPSENQLLTKQSFIHPNSSALHGKYLPSERGPSHKQRGGAGPGVRAEAQTGSRAAVLALRGPTLDQDGHRTDTRHPQHLEELPWAEVTQGQGCPHQLQHGDWGSCRTRELLGASCCCPQAARDEARGSCVVLGRPPVNTWSAGLR